jgi:purine nucleoside phosphorylase
MALVAVLTDDSQGGLGYETPYGQSAGIERVEVGDREILVCAQEFADPRATVRALKDLGATHLWLCESVGALSPLLEAGDWLVPDDYIDGTRGYRYTYFAEKAGGYVQQVPPFDSASRDALLAGAAEVAARPFRRGVYACVSNTRLETPAEAAFWGRAGAHVVGGFLSPCLTLARELDMAVAALVCVVRAGGEPGEGRPFDDYLPVLTKAVLQLG